MVYFEDFEENGEQFLGVTADSTIKAEDADHKFPVHPSMLRPAVDLDPYVMKEAFPQEMTLLLNGAAQSRPIYLLKSCLEKFEEFTGNKKPFLLGRKIIDGHIDWGFNSLRIPGEATHIPMYWEWTEDILGRYSQFLKDIGIYDAVCASLYLYDRHSDVIRAFCECWCPLTNTLHTEAGEWSLSLRDLQMLCGLPICGHPYDEAIPSYRVMIAQDEHGARKLSRTCEYLFSAYCILADDDPSQTGVSAERWIKFWCKQENKYGPFSPDGSKPAKLTPTGDIADKPSNWNSEESVFLQLGIHTNSEKRTTYLAAHLSCWLCTFVLPVNDKRSIRPATFEVATLMAKGQSFSLAPVVLANIYRGLNRMVTSDRPSRSSSYFPAHYLYGWMAHYFNTHRLSPDIPAGPLMVQYSGSRIAKRIFHEAARDMILTGSAFRASSLVLIDNKCETVCDDETLPALKFEYLVSLRSAYLPLRDGSTFYLEPYNPTRFSRQFGFCQDVPCLLKRRANGGRLSFEDALNSSRMLLFRESGSRVMLPGRMRDWQDLTTEGFKRWWRNVTVTDLRENIKILASSVTYGRNNGRNKPFISQDVKFSKRAVEHSTEDSCDVNFKLPRVNKKVKIQAQPGLVKEVSKFIPDAAHEVDYSRPTKMKKKEAPVQVQSTVTIADADELSNSSINERTPSVSPPPPSQLRIVKGVDDFKNNMVQTIKRQLLMELNEASYEQVEHIIMSNSDACYKGIESFGGDTSALRHAVDAFVNQVRDVLAARQNVIDEAQIDREITEVKENLKSAQAILEDEHQVVKDQEKRLSYIAENRAKLKASLVELKASLAALDEEEKYLKENQGQQLEKISIVESRVTKFRQRSNDLRASKSKHKDLDEMERKLAMTKKNLVALT